MAFVDKADMLTSTYEIDRKSNQVVVSHILQLQKVAKKCIYFVHLKAWRIYFDLKVFLGFLFYNA